ARGAEPAADAPDRAGAGHEREARQRPAARARAARGSNRTPRAAPGGARELAGSARGDPFGALAEGSRQPSRRVPRAPARGARIASCRQGGEPGGTVAVERRSGRSRRESADGGDRLRAAENRQRAPTQRGERSAATERGQRAAPTEYSERSAAQQRQRAATSGGSARTGGLPGGSAAGRGRAIPGSATLAAASGTAPAVHRSRRASASTGGAQHGRARHGAARLCAEPRESRSDVHRAVCEQLPGSASRSAARAGAAPGGISAST